MNLKHQFFLPLFLVVSYCGSAQWNASSRAISFVGFSGVLFYNRLPDTNPEHSNRPDEIHTQGVALRYSSVMKRNYFSFDFYQHAFRTNVKGGYIISWDHQHTNNGVQISYTGYSWHYEAECTRFGFIPTLNHIFGKIERRIKFGFCLGLGLEKTKQSRILVDHFEKFTDYGSYYLVNDSNIKASDTFHLKQNPNTIVADIALTLKIAIYGPISISSSAGYRFYANPYLGSVGSYYLSKMAYASGSLNYCIFRKKDKIQLSE